MQGLVVNPVIDLGTASAMLKSAAPDWEWLLTHIESKDGHFRFPRQVTSFIERFRIEDYPLVYGNENAMGLALMRAIMSEQEMKEFSAELEAASSTQRGEVLKAICDGIQEGVEAGETYVATRTQAQLEAEYLALGDQEKVDLGRSIQYMGIAVLSIFHQVLSVMIHREKLTTLVAKAKAGDDSAFVRAVQIDKRILTTDPYFKSRFLNANAEGNEHFRDKLSYRLRCAPYKGKVRHKSLWMAFAFLDMCGHLDTLKHREMLDLFDEAGIGGYKNRIEDVKYLSKRHAEYKAFQQNFMRLSTP